MTVGRPSVNHRWLNDGRPITLWLAQQPAVAAHFWAAVLRPGDRGSLTSLRCSALENWAKKNPNCGLTPYFGLKTQTLVEQFVGPLPPPPDGRYARLISDKLGHKHSPDTSSSFSPGVQISPSWRLLLARLHR